MDRFIVNKYKLQKGVIINLKSNMDRFIECKLFFLYSELFYLKSNMDRFIGLRLYPFDIDKKLFKIQYG